MLGFISENLGSIIIGAAVLAVLVLIIVKTFKRGGSGICSCGDCSNCSSSGSCNLRKDPEKSEKKK